MWTEDFDSMCCSLPPPGSCRELWFCSCGTCFHRVGTQCAQKRLSGGTAQKGLTQSFLKTKQYKYQLIGLVKDFFFSTRADNSFTAMECSYTYCLKSFVIIIFGTSEALPPSEVL